ncbi:winged helix-turn-helix transcriptional regulator [Pelomonas caseinilytica]|uniref:winged helix-turn-helix transcriptional regulator n=1 Tax=Pelomonas caseinilytica TaxID=2906763 RepID=UPI003B017B43
MQARPAPAATAATAAAAPDLDEQIRHLAAEGRLSRRDMAARLGLSERTLYRRLKALDLG